MNLIKRVLTCIINVAIGMAQGFRGAVDLVSVETLKTVGATLIGFTLFELIQMEPDPSFFDVVTGIESVDAALGKIAIIFLTLWAMSAPLHFPAKSARFLLYPILLCIIGWTAWKMFGHSMAILLVLGTVLFAKGLQHGPDEIR